MESTKSVSDVFAPLTAKVVGVNSDLDGNPELVNGDPYEAGWLVDVEVGSKDELDAALADTLDADGYRAITQN